MNRAASASSALLYAAALLAPGCGDEPASEGARGQQPPRVIPPPPDVLVIEPPAAPPPPGHPGPLAPIAGLHGFRIQTHRAYDGAADLPYSTDATFVFPGRARLLVQDETTPGQRSLLFRFGDDLYHLQAGTDESSTLTGLDAVQVARNLELLRAAVLWPDGPAWSDVAGARVAELIAVGELALGSLRCELGEDGRAARLIALDPEGREQEQLRIVAWREHRGRTWPSRLELWSEGARIYVDEVEPIETRVFASDEFFLPPDRRPKTTAPTDPAPSAPGDPDREPL